MGRLACLGIEQANLNYSMCLPWPQRRSRCKQLALTAMRVHTKAARLAENGGVRGAQESSYSL